MVMSFVLSFFPRGVLDEILNLIESVYFLLLINYIYLYKVLDNYMRIC